MHTIDNAALDTVTGGNTLPIDFNPQAESAPGINLAGRLKTPEAVKGIGLGDLLRAGEKYYPAQGE